MVKEVFHGIALVLLVLIIILDRVNNMPKFPLCFLYLTQVNLYLNTLYYLIALIRDCYPKASQCLDRSYNFLVGLSFRVFIMFWMLFGVDKGALFTKKQTFSFFSFVLSFLLHGGVFIICLLDQFLGNKRHKPKYINPIIFLVVSFAYGYSLKVLYHYCGIKVYPFVYKSSFLTLTFICLLGFIVSLLGHYYYVWLTSRDKAAKEKEKRDEGEELITNNAHP